VKLPDEYITVKILRSAKQLAQSENHLLRIVFIKKYLTFKERRVKGSTEGLQNGHQAAHEKTTSI
jgi:hypothetical protein